MLYRLVLLCILSFFIGTITIKAQQFSVYKKQSFVQNGDTLPYRILLPQNFDAGKKYPLIIFLHGAGERGNDNEKQLTHGAALFMEKSKQHPAIVVFPQCPQTSYWSSVTFNYESGKREFLFSSANAPTPAMQLLMGLVTSLQHQYKINQQQMYVMGLSMGGMGTFELVNRMPATFAAAISICGGGDTATAKNIAQTKWWVFHGAKDDVVPVKYSDAMVAAIKKQKGVVKYTVFPNANHNSWDATFATPGLLQWLFSNKR